MILFRITIKELDTQEYTHYINVLTHGKYTHYFINFQITHIHVKAS